MSLSSGVPSWMGDGQVILGLVELLLSLNRAHIAGEVITGDKIGVPMGDSRFARAYLFSDAMYRHVVRKNNSAATTTQAVNMITCKSVC